MATGDQSDILARIKAVLPAGWFPVTGGPYLDDAVTDDAGNLLTTDDGQGIYLTETVPASATPDLDGLLAGIAWMWSWVYALWSYARLQTRIATAADAFLDMISLDFFGVGVVPRRSSEPDDSFRARIKRNLLRPRGTRAAMISALTDLTGRPPTIFEPRNAGDTGAYGHLGSPTVTGLAYNAAGGYGSLALPFQAFITAYRPIGQGIANVGGYGTEVGGYGVGALEYASPSLITGSVTDQDIYDEVARTMPAAAIGWTRISS
jgi:hypothetical protein